MSGVYLTWGLEEINFECLVVGRDLLRVSNRLQ